MSDVEPRLEPKDVLVAFRDELAAVRTALGALDGESLLDAARRMRSELASAPRFLNRRLCPGCGRVWHARRGGCTSCSWETGNDGTPPTVGQLLSGDVPPAWKSDSAYARGIARAAGVKLAAP